MYPYGNPNLLARGLNFTRGIRSINWGGLLDGAQKTLGVINQAIPIVYQVKPIINNAKTMFRIANVINTPDPPPTTNLNNTQNISNNTNVSAKNSEPNTPIFYI